MKRSERKRPYLGLKDGWRTVFWSVAEPTQASHPEYNAVIGPFRTKRGAEFMRDFGSGNPHCQDVNDAEKLGRRFSKGKLRLEHVPNIPVSEIAEGVIKRCQ